MKESRLSKTTKKITDFLTVEDGTIAKESMMLTASILAVTVAGQAILSAEAVAAEHSKWSAHADWSKSGDAALV